MSFTEHQVNGILYHTADGLSAAGGVCHAFSTRRGGVSRAPMDSLNFFGSTGDTRENLLENYRRLGAAVGFDAARAVGCRQVHGKRVYVARAEDAGRILSADRPCEADALITDVPGLPLVVFSADCCTILLSDPVTRCVGAVHAGWRGTALGVVSEAVRAMGEVYGARAGDLHAALGPSIGPCCFETDADVPEAMYAGFGAEAARFITRTGNKYHVDNKGINRAWLLRAGLLPDRIEVHPDCSMCRPDRYWSHRAMGQRRGGQIAVILREDAP